MIFALRGIGRKEAAWSITKYVAPESNAINCPEVVLDRAHHGAHGWKPQSKFLSRERHVRRGRKSHRVMRGHGRHIARAFSTRVTSSMSSGRTGAPGTRQSRPASTTSKTRRARHADYISTTSCFHYIISLTVHSAKVPRLDVSDADDPRALADILVVLMSTTNYDIHSTACTFQSTFLSKYISNHLLSAPLNWHRSLRPIF